MIPTLSMGHIAPEYQRYSGKKINSQLAMEIVIDLYALLAPYTNLMEHDSLHQTVLFGSDCGVRRFNRNKRIPCSVF